MAEALALEERVEKEGTEKEAIEKEQEFLNYVNSLLSRKSESYKKEPYALSVKDKPSLQDILLNPALAYTEFGVIVNTVSPLAAGSHDVLGFFDHYVPNEINISDELAIQYPTADWYETAVHELGHQKRMWRNPYSDGSAADEELDNRRWLAYGAYLPVPSYN